MDARVGRAVTALNIQIGSTGPEVHPISGAVGSSPRCQAANTTAGAEDRHAVSWLLETPFREGKYHSELQRLKLARCQLNKEGPHHA